MLIVWKASEAREKFSSFNERIGGLALVPKIRKCGIKTKEMVNTEIVQFCAYCLRIWRKFSEPAIEIFIGKEIYLGSFTCKESLFSNELTHVGSSIQLGERNLG